MVSSAVCYQTHGWALWQRDRFYIKAREQHSGQPPTRPVQQSRETWGVRATRRPWMARPEAFCFQRRFRKWRLIEEWWYAKAKKKGSGKLCECEWTSGCKFLLGTTQWKKGTRSTQPVPTLVPSFMRVPWLIGAPIIPNDDEWWSFGILNHENPQLNSTIPEYLVMSSISGFPGFCWGPPIFGYPTEILT